MRETCDSGAATHSTWCEVSTDGDRQDGVRTGARDDDARVAGDPSHDPARREVVDAPPRSVRIDGVRQHDEVIGGRAVGDVEPGAAPCDRRRRLDRRQSAGGDERRDDDAGADRPGEGDPARGGSRDGDEAGAMAGGHDRRDAGDRADSARCRHLALAPRIGEEDLERAQGRRSGLDRDRCEFGAVVTQREVDLA